MTIPSIYGGWTIDLADIELLDDVTILDSVDFGSAGGTPQVSGSTLTIEASNGEEIVLTMSGAHLASTVE